MAQDLAFDPTILAFLAAFFVIPAAAVGAGIFLVFMYQHEDDKCRAWLPKIIFVIAFSLGTFIIPLLPLDVAAVNFNGFGIAPIMDLVLGISWQLYYSFVIIFVLIVVPFGMFYYEAEDPDRPGIKGVVCQSLWALLFTLIMLLIVVGITLATYPFFGVARIGVAAYTSASYTEGPQSVVNTNTTSIVIPATAINAANATCATCFSVFYYTNYWSSFVVYFIAVLCIFGWLALLLLGGCGLTATPSLNIKAIISRPKKVSSSEFVDLKYKLMLKSEQLIEVGNRILEAQDEGKLNRAELALYNDFKQATQQVEKDWKTLETRFYLQGGSIILPIIQLIFGIIRFEYAFLSIFWIIHVILYLGLPPEIFSFGALNIAFYFADYATLNFPILGAFLYCVMVGYLLISVLGGITLIANRLPISVHPMKKGETMMNSMLFNVEMWLLCSIAVGQFATNAFGGYAKQTIIQSTYGGIISNLFVLGYFFKYVHYAFLLFAIVGLVVSCACINRPKSAEEKEYNNLVRRWASEPSAPPMPGKDKKEDKK